MAQLTDHHALLLFRVGPVLCCAPTLSIETLILPPSLTHPPGSSESRPGIFRHADKLVSLIEVRQLFGVEESDRKQPGRIVVCHFGNQHTGFLVDEVSDVIDTPTSGWRQLSASLSGGVFTRSLLLDKKIHLYCEFEKLQIIRQIGFLKPWIQQLQEKNRCRKNMSTHAPACTTVLPKKPAPANTSMQSGTIPPPPTAPLPAVSDRRPPLDPPLKQQRTHIRNNKADKTQAMGKQTATSNPLQTENKTRQSAADVKPGHSASPSDPTSLARHAAKISRPLKPPHPTDHKVRTQANKAETNLPIMAAVLICIALISAIAYLWPNYATNPVVITSVSDSPVVETLTPAKPHPRRPETTFSPTTENARNNEPAEASATAMQEDQDNRGNYYQANIEQRPHEVTIILTAPANDTVIRSNNDHPVAPKLAAEIHPAIESTPAFVSSRLSSPRHIDETVYTVVRGDTLWHIARRYIHNPFRYPELARLNKIPNPNLIYPGDRVRIIRIYRQPSAPTTAD
ncbi:hypothetical protein MNBD_GAMMA24-975 [hydrothermal vent metagenome]|uniref:LysM domain-containing protein n=1 Tax=hydrothermal vent metagenome TaxID=652676 RepID=A0A3B1C7K5_9ZZZZ